MKNKFSLSLSRIRTYEHCLWAYYLKYYYGSTRSGLGTRPIVTTTPSAQIGKLIHKEIENVLLSLQAGRPISCDDAIHNATISTKENPEFITGCLTNFFASDIYLELNGLDNERILSIEGSEVHKMNKIQEFEFSGVPVYMKIDLAYRNTEDNVVIVDWKTGKTKETISNLTHPLYALYALHNFDVEPNQILCVEYNLFTGTKHSKQIDEGVISELEDKLNGYIKGMKSLLSNEPKNRPVEPIYFKKDGKEKGHCIICEYQSNCD